MKNAPPEGMHQKLKLMYDDYHFSEKSEDIYNPYSMEHDRYPNYCCCLTRGLEK